LVFPALIFVVWAKTYHPEVEFYNEAIKEGIGANLWNLIGLFGLFSFSLAVIFSKEEWIAKIARNILINTYAIGSLNLGAFLGIILVSEFSIDLVWWKREILIFSFLLGVIFFFVLNFSIWFMVFLIQNEPNQKSNFFIKLEKINVFWKVFIGLFPLIVIIFLVLIEK